MIIKDMVTRYNHGEKERKERKVKIIREPRPRSKATVKLPSHTFFIDWRNIFRT